LRARRVASAVVAHVDSRVGLLRRRGFLLGSNGYGFESRRPPVEGVAQSEEHWTASSAAPVLRPATSQETNEVLTTWPSSRVSIASRGART
jgi:hypothetical protein